MDLPRKTIVDILLAVEQRRVFANEALSEALAAESFDLSERRFVAAMVYGVLRLQEKLDRDIGLQLDKPFHTLSPLQRNLLRLGLYQMDYAYSVPPEVAVATTVELARNLGLGKGGAGLINAVLRNLSRERKILLTKERPLKYGLNNELFGILKKDYGEAAAYAIAAAMLDADATLSLRVNRLRTDPDALIGILREEGIEAARSPYLEDALRFDLQGRDLTRIPSFQQGLWTVQGEAPMVLGAIAPVQPGDRVLDACAAPGGKTGHLAERMGDEGTVVAAEVSAKRLPRLEELRDRMGYRSVAILQRDAAAPLPEAERESYDLVVLDVPCSAFGLLGKQPELRHRLSYDEIRSFLPVQAKILKEQSRGVKPGGHLIYATCSLTAMENGEQVAAFLDSPAGADFRRVPVRDRVPECLRERALYPAAGEILLRPDKTGTDGFFIALLQRTTS